MNKLILPAICVMLCVSISWTSATHKPIISIEKLPVNLVFQKPAPPDSIQDFLKIYLRTKKVDVINFDQLMTIYKEEIMSKSMKAIDGGTFNNKTAESIPNTPISNMLAVQIFNDTLDQYNYKIDSIKWYVTLWPVSDTSIKKYIFIPKKTSDTFPYTTLKAFTDKVLSSKLLK